MKKLYFLTEGGAGIGLGHIARCVAIAEAVGNQFSIHFVLTTGSKGSSAMIERKEFPITFLDEFSDFPIMAEENDLVVTDSYSITGEIEFELESVGAKVLAILDHTDELRMAMAYINPAGGIDPLKYTMHSPYLVFSGPAYAPLRKEFIQDASMPVYADKTGVVICFGGTDPENNLLHFGRKCHEILPEEKITLVSGSAYAGQAELGSFLLNKKNVFHQANLTPAGMAELFRTGALAITSPSTVAYEACSCKIPLIVRQTADNQEELFRFLGSSGLAHPISYLDELKQAILQVNNENKIDEMLEKQARWFDGRTDERLAALLNSMADEFSFRMVNEADTELLLKWANDPVTRMNSYHTTVISREAHEKWLGEKLQDAFCRLWMAEDVTGELGLIRLEKVGSGQWAVFEISINVAPDHREKGWGKKMLRRAALHFFSEFPGQTLTAWIKKDNVPSQNVFAAAGFVIAAEELKNKCLSVKMTRSE